MSGSIIESIPAFAAMLMAGLDGNINKIEPPAPVDKDLIDTWINFKRKQEVDYVRLFPHPAEFELYFDL